MRVTLTAVLVALVALVGCAADDEEVASSEDSIVNGALANGEHPEVAMLSLVDAKGNPWVCTGTFVGRRTLLTARHCFENGVIGPDGSCNGSVHVDTTGLGARQGAHYGIASCVLPDLGAPGRANDLALVRIDHVAEGIMPARIAHDLPDERLYTVYGYGGFGPARGGHCAETTDGDNKRTLTYRGALSWHVARYVCPGDSGGPHFVAGSNLIAGVSSTASAVGVDIQAVPYRYADVLEAHIAQLER